MQKIITPNLFFLFFFQFSFLKNVIFLLFFHIFISLLSASLYWVTYFLVSPFIKHLLSAAVYWSCVCSPDSCPPGAQSPAASSVVTLQTSYKWGQERVERGSWSSSQGNACFLEGSVSGGVATGLSPQFSILLVFVLLENMTSIVTKLSDRTKCGKAMLIEGIGV